MLPDHVQKLRGWHACTSGCEQNQVRIVSHAAVGMLQAGELVELSNENADNPRAWLVRVTEAGTDSVQVRMHACIQLHLHPDNSSSLL